MHCLSWFWRSHIGSRNTSCRYALSSHTPSIFPFEQFFMMNHTQSLQNLSEGNLFICRRGWAELPATETTPPTHKKKIKQPIISVMIFLGQQGNKTFPTKPQRIRTTAVVAWPHFPWHCVASCQGNPSLHLVKHTKHENFRANDWKITPGPSSLTWFTWKSTHEKGYVHWKPSFLGYMEPNFPKLWFRWFSFRIFWGTHELLVPFVKFLGCTFN